MPQSYFASGFWFGVLVAAAGASIICLWVGLALGAGRIAKRRGYRRGVGLGAGILTGPIAVVGIALLPTRRRVHRRGHPPVHPATQRANVELVRRALEGDPDVLDEHMAWHFQSPHPELVLHFEGKYQYTSGWINRRRTATGDSFRQRPAGIWPLGDDLVVAHVEVAMTENNVPREGTSVVVYRVADGAVIEGFDIPSASLVG